MTKIHPKDLKPGQRVRVTFDATVAENAGSSTLYLKLLDHDDVMTAFVEKEFSALTCELLPDPIGAGDRVRYRGSLAKGSVLAIDDGYAWVACTNSRVTWPLCDITKIEGDA